VSELGPLTDRQWAIFRSRMEELANPQGDGITSPVRHSYLAEMVLILMDRLDDLEQRLSRSVSPLSAVVRRELATLTQEDWDAFLAEHGQYVMDGWGDLRAFRTALGTLLAQLERKQKQTKGRRKRA
jgi:uncharacterized membrane protein YccC